MNEDELMHFGVLGMKWGRRKSKKKSSTKKPTNNKKNVKTSKKPAKKVKVKELSDEDLQKKIKRLQLEKQYRDLKRDEVSSGKKLVGEILKISGKTVGVQVTTYAAGKLINKLVKDDVVKVGSTKKKAS